MVFRAPSALLALVMGGTSVQESAPAEAVFQDVIRLAKDRVQRFRAHARELPPQGTPWFELLEGKSRVLVTAPHATAHLRGERLKGSDLGTGALAVVLNRLAEAPALYTTWAAPSDPSFYDDNPFKERLAALVRQRKPGLVLDLHASREDRPYDLDFGTLRGDSLRGRTVLLDKLRRQLRAAGLQNLSDNAFAGERQATVVRFLYREGVPCVQLEINARWLRPEEGPAGAERFFRLAKALTAFIEELDS